jgi:hypothetical protein
MSDKTWEKKGERAARKAGQGPGAPQEDACLAGSQAWFQRQMAEDAAKKIPAEHRTAFERGYARGIRAWASKLQKRKWCKTLREDEGV